MNAKNSLNALKQNPVALVVFIIGVLGFIYVCMLAIKTFTGADKPASEIEVSQDEIDQFKRDDIQNTQEEVTQKRKAKRQKNIKERDITGAWDTYLGQTRALLQLKDDQFRLIMIDRDDVRTRYYINGAYRLEDDILYLDPDTRSAPPKGDFDYEILTRAEFPVMVSKHRGKMVWMRPSDDVDIYVPNYHVILDRVQNDIAVWSTLK